MDGGEELSNKPETWGGGGRGWGGETVGGWVDEY